MAETFSIDTGGPQAARPSAGDVAVMSQIQPNAPGQNTISPMAQPDTGMNQATVKALLQLGSDTVAPKVKEAAQQQFMEGVQRASTGEAVKDIVESQPWYTQVFGPSSAVAGARGYNVATRVAQFGADMELAMPELAKEGPEQLTAKVNGFMKTLRTGDAATDAAITSQVVDQMAPLYKRQAKEHYLYQQRQANQAQTDAWTSASSALQTRTAAHAKDPTMVTAQDVQAEGDRFLSLMNPFPGQSDESYEKNVARMVAAAGDQGNFQVISLLKQRGIYDKIDPQIRTNLDASLRASGGRTLAKLQGTPEYAEKLATLFYDMTQNPRDIPAKIEAINEDASKLTGVPREYASLIAPQNADNLMGRVATSQLHAAESAAKAGMKQAQDQLLKDRAVALAGSAQGVSAAIAVGKDNGGIEASDAQQAVGTLFFSSKTPDAKARVLENNSGFTSKVAQRVLTDPLISAEYTPALNSTVDVFAAMSPDTRGVYFSDTQIGFLSRYQALRSGGDMKGEAAWTAAKSLNPIAKNALSDTDKTASAKAIRTYTESRWSNMVGWNSINDHDLGTVQTVIANSLKNVDMFGSTEDAVRGAMRRAENSGLIEKLGGRVIIGTAPKDGFVPSTSLFLKGQNNGGQEEVGDAFEAVLKKGAEVHDVDPDSAVIIRMPDVGGEPRYMVMGQKEGRQASWAITGQEVRANLGETRTKERTDAQKRALLAKQLDDRTPPTNARFMGIGQYQPN